MSNCDTAPFELSQFGAWYFLAGLESYLEFADMECQIDTLELELARVENWDREFGGYYNPEQYVKIRARLAEIREWIQRCDSEWYAGEARKEFRVIDGGKS